VLLLLEWNGFIGKTWDWVIVWKINIIIVVSVLVAEKSDLPNFNKYLQSKCRCAAGVSFKLYLFSAVMDEITKAIQNEIYYVFGGRDYKVDGTRRAMTINGDVLGEVEIFKHLDSFVLR